jgi:hypothetical protein
MTVMSQPSIRRTKKRMVEEIDLAGARRRQLVLAGECKWTHSPMPRSVLDELRESASAHRVSTSVCRLVDVWRTLS